MPNQSNHEKELVRLRSQPRIFLCHASEDKPRVMELYSQLQAVGYHPWLDKFDLLPGQNWRREIKKIITDPYNIVVICLSCNSTTKRGVVQEEMKWALDVLDQQPEDTIYLIPARLEECQSPDRLKGLHWVDLFEPNGFEYLKRALDSEISRSRGKPEPVAITPGRTSPPSPPELKPVEELADPAITRVPLPSEPKPTPLKPPEIPSSQQPIKPVLLTQKLLKLARDPIWQMIGVLVAIIGVAWPVTFYVSENIPATPTRLSLIEATSTQPIPIVNSPSPTLTNTPPSPSQVTTEPVPVLTTPAPTGILPVPTGNLAIPLISGFGPKVYLTEFDGQGVNGPNPISLDAQQPMFSQDGKSIMVKGVIDGVTGLYKLTASGFNPEIIISRGSNEWPVLSPDGGTVMFSESTLNYRLLVRKPDGATEEVFLNGLPLFAKNLLWSEDNQLVFQGCATWLNEPDTCGIWVTNVNSLNPQRIAENKNAYPMSAREGSLAYMSQEDGDWEVYVVPLKGGPTAKLTDNNFEDGLPVISPDGNDIAYISNESGSWGLWIMNMSGRNKKWMFDIDPGRGTIDPNQWNTERMGWRR